MPRFEHLDGDELRRVARELDSGRSKYAELYDGAPVGYCTLDAAGQIREINATGAGLLGVERDALIGRCLCAFVAPTDRVACEEHVRRCCSERTQVTTDLAFPLRARTPVILQLVSTPVTCDAEPLVRTVFMDISAMKSLETRLRLLAEAGDHLASSLDEAATRAAGPRVVVPTLADVCVLDVCEASGALVRAEVVCGLELPASLAPELRAIDPTASASGLEAQVVESGESIHLAELPSTVRAWASRSLELLAAVGATSIVIVPLRARGRVLGAMTLARAAGHLPYTVADLRLAEELARRIGVAIDNARLYAQAQRAIQGRDAVLALVSHDLRSPLGVILMRTALMLDRSIAQERRTSRKALEAIQRSAVRMNRLIGDLLDIASIEAGHLSVERHPEDAAGLAVEATDLLMPAATARKVELDADLGGVLGIEVPCDRGRVLQVLENLIGNAIKFAPRGGHVHVVARRAGNDLAFSVSDDGPGIARADAKRIFDRFWQMPGSSARLGTGLGLSIAKGLVEAHGGHIWVEPGVTQGATFVFTLPLAPGDVAVAEPPRRGPLVSSAARQLRTVLVVDDDVEVQDAMRETLEHAGFMVETAGNGVEALDYLRTHASPVAVVLDLAMPVMDGRAFLGVRARDPTLYAIPVMVVSTVREPPLDDASVTMLAKPVDPVRLIETIAQNET